MFEGLTEFASYFDLVFVPVCWIHVANRAVTRFLLLRRCVESFSGFFVENTVVHAHRQPGQVRSSTVCVCVRGFMTRMITWPISCSRSTVHLLGLSTNKLCCALVRNSLHDMTRYLDLEYEL